MVGIGKSRLCVLDYYTCHSRINIKEIVGYNRLELRARSKFESYEYIEVFTAIELIFEIQLVSMKGEVLHVEPQGDFVGKLLLPHKVSAVPNTDGFRVPSASKLCSLILGGATASQARYQQELLLSSPSTDLRIHTDPCQDFTCSRKLPST